MAYDYVFNVWQSKMDGQWRWVLLKPSGARAVPSAMRFKTQGACRRDAEDHRKAICEAAITTVA